MIEKFTSHSKKIKINITSKLLGDVLETINTNRTNMAGRASTLPSEIDRIMAKIDQDNRVLAELDKTRSTIGENNLNLCEVYYVNT